MNDNHTTTSSPQVVLVTGASRGIGAAIADTFAKHNHKVIGTATSESGAKAIHDRLTKLQPDSMGVCLNVTDGKQLDEQLKHIETTVGTPLVLINNAGITKDNSFMRMSDSEWDDVIETNLSSLFRVTKRVIRYMIKARYGRIISIASIVGDTGNPGQVNYSSSKAGMMGFTRSLARELGARNITANCIAPGFIDTDMTKKLNEQQRNQISQQIPLNRMGKPEDIANMCLFLVEQGDYITGQTIHINGGMYVT